MANLELPSGSIAYAVDSDTHKHGTYLPLSSLPIHSPQHLRQESVENIIVTSYTYFDEILAQLDWFLADGGKVIRVYPSPEVLSGAPLAGGRKNQERVRKHDH